MTWNKLNFVYMYLLVVLQFLTWSFPEFWLFFIIGCHICHLCFMHLVVYFYSCWQVPQATSGRRPTSAWSVWSLWRAPYPLMTRKKKREKEKRRWEDGGFKNPCLKFYRSLYQAHCIKFCSQKENYLQLKKQWKFHIKCCKCE